MPLNEILAILMFISACGALLSGYPVAFTLGGIALAFMGIAELTGVFAYSMFTLPSRIYSIISREMLMAVPLFVFMGVVLERSRIAEDLLEAMSDLMGSLRGGLGVSVVLVGALLAASTGIVGATVVTMGLLSLPTMLKRGYDPGLATGSITASGTLGQIIPPSIVLVILGDQFSIAYQNAQNSLGADLGGVVSVGDLFAGAIIPGIILVGLYCVYIIGRALFQPSSAPPTPRPEGVPYGKFMVRVLKATIPPILLIVAVLGSILSGYATPTDAAALGALGAIMLAGYRTYEESTPSPMVKWSVLIGGMAIVGLVLIRMSGTDLRLNQDSWNAAEMAGIIAAFACIGLAALGVLMACIRLIGNGRMQVVTRSTMHITAMVFVILIGATIFSLVFRGLGGDHLVSSALASMPGGKWGALIIVMLVMFVLGFFLDFIEITFVVVPLVAPPLMAMGMDPVWLGILMALNLQTSFLTPPFGFALFYLRGVAPPSVRTVQIYKGVLPFIGLQILMILLVVAWPELATWLPEKLLN